MPQLQEILNVLNIRENESLNSSYFGEVLEVQNKFVNIALMDRPGKIFKSLVLGPYFPKEGDKGTIFMVQNKYPCFYPFFNIANTYILGGETKLNIDISGVSQDIVKLSKEENVKLLLKYCKKIHVVDVNQIAFILGSVEQESGFDNTIDNAEEKSSGRFGNFWGRGLIQLTLEPNYIKFNPLLGQDFVKNPELVKVPEYSAYIAVYGMAKGIFTGLDLDDFLTNVSLKQENDAEVKKIFYNARQIVTGKGRFQGADNVVRYSMEWRKKILEGKLLWEN